MPVGPPSANQSQKHETIIHQINYEIEIGEEMPTKQQILKKQTKSGEVFYLNITTNGKNM